jgi:hypothetical protein
MQKGPSIKSNISIVHSKERSSAPIRAERSNTASPPENKLTYALGVNPAKNTQGDEKCMPVEKCETRSEQKHGRMF